MRKLPKSAGILKDVDFALGEATDEKPALRDIDVFDAREFALDAHRSKCDDAAQAGRDKPPIAKCWHEYAADYLGHPREDWPKARASAFWEMVFGEVDRLGKPDPA